MFIIVYKQLYCKKETFPKNIYPDLESIMWLFILQWHNENNVDVFNVMYYITVEMIFVLCNYEKSWL